MQLMQIVQTLYQHTLWAYNDFLYSRCWRLIGYRLTFERGGETNWVLYAVEILSGPLLIWLLYRIKKKLIIRTAILIPGSRCKSIRSAWRFPLLSLVLLELSWWQSTLGVQGWPTFDKIHFCIETAALICLAVTVVRLLHPIEDVRPWLFASGVAGAVLVLFPILYGTLRVLFIVVGAYFLVAILGRLFVAAGDAGIIGSALEMFADLSVYGSIVQKAEEEGYEEWEGQALASYILDYLHKDEGNA